MKNVPTWIVNLYENLTTKVFDALLSLGTKMHPEVEEDFSLMVLSPTVEFEENYIYVWELKEQLKDKSIKNIALSGNFGSGKSSIIKQLLESSSRLRRTSLIISLPKFTDVNNKAVETNKDQQDTESIDTIQKEIIKQLLYSDKPYKFNQSKFIRTTNKRGVWGWISLVLFMFSFILAASYLTIKVIFDIHLADLESNLDSILIHIPILNIDRIRVESIDKWEPLATYICIAIIVLGIVYFIISFILRKSGGKEKLHIASDAISLEKDINMEYFDKFLDEIIYFFERTKYRTIVFEDLDRFDNPVIFEMLNHLNLVINSAKQIKNKPVRFIYSLKDGVFRDANIRVKVFDIIIPIAPPITDLNSKDFFIKFNEKAKINGDLLSILSKYVTDIRLVKSISNEYKVFSKIILSLTSLNKNNLFAMIAIKNILPNEFENLQKGKGVIDAIFQKCLDIHKSKMHEHQKALFNGVNVPEDPGEAGSELYKSILLEADAKKYGNISDILRRNGESGTLTQRITKEDLKKEDFWRYIASQKDVDEVIDVRFNTGNTLKCTRQQVVIMAGGEIIDNLNANRLNTIFAHFPELKDADRTEIFKSVSNDERLLISEIIIDEYIDDSYKLYITPYKDTVLSIEAQNFKLQCLRGSGAKHSDFPLSKDGAKEILGILNKTDYSNIGLLNVDLFKYLFNKNTEFTDTEDIIAALAKLHPKELITFILPFITKKLEDIALTDLLTYITKYLPEDIIVAILSSSDASNAERSNWLSVVIPLLSDDFKVEFNNHQKNTLRDILPSLFDKAHKLDDPAKIKVVSFMAVNDIKIASLSKIKNTYGKELIIHNELYDITPANIKVVGVKEFAKIMSDFNLSSDELNPIISTPDSFTELKNVVIDHISDYVDKLNSSSDREILNIAVSRKGLSLEQLSVLIEKIAIKDLDAIYKMLANNVEYLSPREIVSVVSMSPEPIDKFAKPFLRFSVPNKPYIRQFIIRMKRRDFVSTFNIKSENDTIEVRMKHTIPIIVPSIPTSVIKS